MSHCLILQHDGAFGPGRVVPVFRDFGIPTRVVRLDRGEPLPDHDDEVRLTVVLGGPQRLTGGDDYADTPAWLDDEVAFLRRRVDADTPTVGFGLGAQLLAKAAGAAVHPLTKPAKEGETPEPASLLGWGGVTLPFPGGTDPAVFGLVDNTPMFFWQKDGFDLPKLPPPAGYDPNKPGPPPPTGNLLLCASAHTRNAAFRFKNRLYGFAFHPECDRDGLDTLLKTHGGAVGAAYGSGAVDRVRADTDRHYPRYERLGNRLLANLVQYLKAYNPPR